MNKPCLFIFSGLPAAGKSSLAQALAKKLNATFVRIDTIEHGLLEICKYKVQGGEGYELAHLIAADNLKLGNNVVADSVNPWSLTRNAWNQVAILNTATFVNIEVICSDRAEHKKRAQDRVTENENMKSPTWDEILNRDYHAWTEQRVAIDTAGRTVMESCDELFRKLGID